MGIEMDLLSAVRDPGELIDVTSDGNREEGRKYMRIDISNLDALYESALQLALEQRLVFNKVMEYCRGLRKNFHSCPLEKFN